VRPPGKVVFGVPAGVRRLRLPRELRLRLELSVAGQRDAVLDARVQAAQDAFNGQPSRVLTGSRAACS